ncbi:ABC transporter permease [Amycolatopsis anabasis]|uniref:ABC transporter permease n=1 Tax=Amycolatopsis anabasis TaxID=1840409 RepID=UPI001FE270CD|nr:ABC transporter permease [Amycolatopsis anabasis]
MTTATFAIPRTPGDRIRWAVADYWTMTRRGLAHWARQPGQVVFGLLFSVMITVMFAFLLGGAMIVPGGGNYREFLMPGMFVMVTVFGIGETATAVLNDAAKGVTDRFRSMPMAPSAVVVGRCLSDMALALVNLAVMIGCGLAIGWRPSGSFAETLAAIGLLVLLRFAFVWLGIFLGLILKGPEAMTVVHTLEFPLGFLANVFVATATMPSWLATIAEWNPLSSTVSAARELFGNPGAGGDSWIAGHAMLMAVVWPLLIFAVFFPLSVRRYQNLSR